MKGERAALRKQLRGKKEDFYLRLVKKLTMRESTRICVTTGLMLSIESPSNQEHVDGESASKISLDNETAMPLPDALPLYPFAMPMNERYTSRFYPTLAYANPSGCPILFKMMLSLEAIDSLLWRDI